MSDTSEVVRLRRFLLLFAGFICIGTLIELWLEEHTGDFLQWIAFGLSGAVFLSIGAILIAGPRRLVTRLHRGVMVVALVGSVLGVYQHLAHNFAFEREIAPNAAASELWMDTLQGGNPLLAPGVIGIAAILGFLGTPRRQPQ